MDANPDSGCGRTVDPVMDLHGVTLALGGKQASPISLCLTTFPSSVPPLSTARESFCFPHFSITYLLITMASPCPVPSDVWMPSSSPDCEDPGWPVGIFHLPEPSGTRQACGKTFLFNEKVCTDLKKSVCKWLK